MTFDAQERARLAGLADALIPAGEGFPSASQAGVAGEGLDRALSFRPDLAGALKKLASMTLSDAKKDPDLFAVLAEFVPGAYFLNAEVRAKLGYGGQTARPIDPHPDYLDDGLLQSVIERGPIYRPTPGKKKLP
jgi:hypothetical protein